jgi:hypothetical protein
MRKLIGPLLLALFVGCGDVGGESYTAKALDEFRAGNAADWKEKGKKPPAKEVAALQKKVKNFKAGTKKDLHQALWLLSNQREHEELHFNTLAKSTYVRAAYFRVFGKPGEVRDKEEPNTWSHVCTDGKVTLRGFLKDKGEPANMTTFPHKPKF